MILGQPSSRSRELIKVLATATVMRPCRMLYRGRSQRSWTRSVVASATLDPRRHPRTYEQAPRHYHRQIQDDIRSP